ncbi:hypothetical protein X975_05915, partial [Stegodyphus mimosarum]
MHDHIADFVFPGKDLVSQGSINCCCWTNPAGGLIFYFKCK